MPQLDFLTSSQYWNYRDAINHGHLLAVDRYTLSTLQRRNFSISPSLRMEDGSGEDMQPSTILSAIQKGKEPAVRNADTSSSEVVDPAPSIPFSESYKQEGLGPVIPKDPTSLTLSAVTKKVFSYLNLYERTNTYIQKIETEKKDSSSDTYSIFSEESENIIESPKTDSLQPRLYSENDITQDPSEKKRDYTSGSTCEFQLKDVTDLQPSLTKKKLEELGIKDPKWVDLDLDQMDLSREERTEFLNDIRCKIFMEREKLLPPTELCQFWVIDKDDFSTKQGVLASVGSIRQSTSTVNEATSRESPFFPREICVEARSALVEQGEVSPLDVLAPMIPRLVTLHHLKEKGIPESQWSQYTVVAYKAKPASPKFGMDAESLVPHMKGEWVIQGPGGPTDRIKVESYSMAENVLYKVRSHEIAHARHTDPLSGYVLPTANNFPINTDAAGEHQIAWRSLQKVVQYIVTFPGESLSSLESSWWNYRRHKMGEAAVRAHLEQVKERLELPPSGPMYFRTVPPQNSVVPNLQGLNDANPLDPSFEVIPSFRRDPSPSLHPYKDADGNITNMELAEQMEMLRNKRVIESTRMSQSSWRELAHANARSKRHCPDSTYPDSTSETGK